MPGIEPGASHMQKRALYCWAISPRYAPMHVFHMILMQILFLFKIKTKNGGHTYHLYTFKTSAGCQAIGVDDASARWPSLYLNSPLLMLSYHKHDSITRASRYTNVFAVWASEGPAGQWCWLMMAMLLFAIFHCKLNVWLSHKSTCN